MKRNFSLGVVSVAEIKSLVAEAGPKLTLTLLEGGINVLHARFMQCWDGTYGLTHIRQALHQWSSTQKHFSNASPPLFPSVRERESTLESRMGFVIQLTLLTILAGDSFWSHQC